MTLWAGVDGTDTRGAGSDSAVIDTRLLAAGLCVREIIYDFWFRRVDQRQK